MAALLDGVDFALGREDVHERAQFVRRAEGVLRALHEQHRVSDTGQVRDAHLLQPWRWVQRVAQQNQAAQS